MHRTDVWMYASVRALACNTPNTREMGMRAHNSGIKNLSVLFAREMPLSTFISVKCKRHTHLFALSLYLPLSCFLSVCRWRCTLFFDGYGQFRKLNVTIFHWPIWFARVAIFFNFYYCYSSAQLALLCLRIALLMLLLRNVEKHCFSSLFAHKTAFCVVWRFVFCALVHINHHHILFPNHTPLAVCLLGKRFFCLAFLSPIWIKWMRVFFSIFVCLAKLEFQILSIFRCGSRSITAFWPVSPIDSDFKFMPSIKLCNLAKLPISMEIEQTPLKYDDSIQFGIVSANDDSDDDWMFTIERLIPG